MKTNYRRFPLLRLPLLLLALVFLALPVEGATAQSGPCASGGQTLKEKDGIRVVARYLKGRRRYQAYACTRGSKPFKIGYDYLLGHSSDCGLTVDCPLESIGINSPYVVYLQVQGEDPRDFTGELVNVRTGRSRSLRDSIGKLLGKLRDYAGEDAAIYDVVIGNGNELLITAGITGAEGGIYYTKPNQKSIELAHYRGNSSDSKDFFGAPYDTVITGDRASWDSPLGRTTVTLTTQLNAVKTKCRAPVGTTTKLLTDLGRIYRDKSGSDFACLFSNNSPVPLNPTCQSPQIYTSDLTPRYTLTSRYVFYSCVKGKSSDEIYRTDLQSSETQLLTTTDHKLYSQIHPNDTGTVLYWITSYSIKRSGKEIGANELQRYAAGNTTTVDETGNEGTNNWKAWSLDALNVSGNTITWERRLVRSLNPLSLDSERRQAMRASIGQ